MIIIIFIRQGQYYLQSLSHLISENQRNQNSNRAQGHCTASCRPTVHSVPDSLRDLSSVQTRYIYVPE